ncbi:hypothetical protein MKX08_003421 [Trichoderma sp. CBMAI-0020]|nr:hypothetical protein MKX08_003421 [Trichoderma sp. CBMAI-0020]
MTENLNITFGLLKRINHLGRVDAIDALRVANITLGEESEEMNLIEWRVVHLQSDPGLFPARTVTRPSSLVALSNGGQYAVTSEDRPGVELSTAEVRISQNICHSMGEFSNVTSNI